MTNRTRRPLALAAGILIVALISSVALGIVDSVAVATGDPLPTPMHTLWVCATMIAYIGGFITVAAWWIDHRRRHDMGRLRDLILGIDGRAVATDGFPIDRDVIELSRRASRRLSGITE